ncbi:energy-coupling factor ABC transporter ATP-binding protein [Rhizobium sp. TRM95796]|uniref:energy-coupling factor ABC transporter ATP-binding protein n=1 Tax=Rhizobium sp. TRM95796 TaxID=2979862 RepID=UPI0021E8450B|nr:ATP-binding cassette domain-containing protein [Rhizobium sp. TRM95796]MCV3767768.1 ATP-binding cassette domain-containing protein [Rhizobium sp. TRM95796]
MILEARKIGFRYEDGTRALDDVSLRIVRRQKLVILGANGAGKSSLMSLLNGSFKPSAGEVLLNGEPVAYDRKGLTLLRSQVGLVLQDPDDQLFAATVFEDVSFGPLNLGLSVDEARLRVSNALDAMEISDLSHRPTHMLSFGQRKRVAIAGILAMSPSVLLLDEPTAGLDPRGVEDLTRTLDMLAAKGIAVVLATHDMDVAYALADRVAVFAAGRVLMEGAPDAVFGQADFCERSGLRLPNIFQVASGLKDLGLLPSDGDLPRSVDELLRLVSAPR